MNNDNPDELTIVNWNIWNGGNIPRVIETLKEYQPNICILTEYQHAKRDSQNLRETLAELNLNYEISRSDDKNGVLIASDSLLQPINELFADHFEHQKLAVSVTTHGIKIIGVFCKDDFAVDYFHNKFDLLSNDYLNSPALLTGDFNFGARSSDKSRYDKLQKLVDAGWTDLWRHCHGSEINDSCWTHKNQSFLVKETSGFSLVDHFFVSQPLLDKVIGKPFNNQKVLRKRKNDGGFSDHSIISIKIKK